MTYSLKSLAVSTVLMANLTGSAGTASALPAMDRLALQHASPSLIESVQYWGWGWGPAIAGGLLAGAVIGSALAAPYYYAPRPYYYPYYPRPYYYAPAPAGYYTPAQPDAVTYCMHRFRSYNPRTGTYLGTDGYRHPCP